MEIRSIDNFILYYERTREITRRVIQVIPPEKLDWTYQEGKFTLGDLIRHIAAIERHVFMELIQGHAPAYKGCDKTFADGYDETLHYFESLHKQSIEILSSYSDADLQRPVKTMNGKETSMANFLRALIVHEVHHRGAMIIYLNLLGITTPSVLGMKEEQVIEASNSK